MYSSKGLNIFYFPTNPNKIGCILPNQTCRKSLQWYQHLEIINLKPFCALTQFEWFKSQKAYNSLKLMNITITRRSKSHNFISQTRNPKKELQNQQSAETHEQTAIRKNQSLNKKMNEEQNDTCTKWLFQRCLRKPSILGDEVFDEQLIAREPSKEIHRITGRKNRKQAPKVDREEKMELTLRKDKALLRHPQCKIKVICNPSTAKEIQNTQKLSKLAYLERQGSNFEEQKQWLQPFRSQTFENHITGIKNKSKQMEFSMKPSTVVSSNNNSCNQAKGYSGKKLKLSNNFESLLETNVRPLSLHSAEPNPLNQRLDQQTFNQGQSPLEDAFEQRFELVYPSEAEFKIQDPYKSNNSINTSYIRKKIQFSSDMSDKIKLENYVYEPVYTLTYSNGKNDTKNLNNYNSEVIKNICVQNEDFLSSAKIYSEQSMVLEKGLDQIFNLSPTFRKISSEDDFYEQGEKQIIVQNLDDFELFSKNALASYGKRDKIKEQ